MKLIGMLDSPYVRRVAVSLQLLGLPFEHQSLSVFRGFDVFSRINPVVKAPTLVCDDGQVLMDSSLILQYAEALAHPRSLWPGQVSELQHHLRLTGLALAATEKSVQLVYEQGLRPPEKQHEPWVTRVTGQLQAALDLLEQALTDRPLATEAASPWQAALTIAVGWDFITRMTPQAAPAERYPQLVALSARLESWPAFRAAPFGDGTYPVGR